MGNGRWWSGSSGVWVRAMGALLVMLLAGFVLLGSGSRRYAQKATVQVPTPPLPNSSRSGLHSKLDARAILGELPLIFEPNQGQADARAKFLAHGPGYSLFLDATGAVLAMQTARSSSSSAGPAEQFVRMNLVGANPAAATTGTDPLPGRSNYFIGNDRRKWHSGIPQFAGVRYENVYPGIDLVFYGNQGRLEYDFRVAPGADPSRAELQFNGATTLKLSGGDLVLTGKEDGGLRLQAPHVYQREGDRHKPVAGRFVLRSANRVGFEIGPYDRGRELIIDPQLVFSSYFGGSGSETSPSVAVNDNGNIYLTGTTTSPQSSFPSNSWTSIPSTLQIAATGPSHIFVAEINPSLPAVVYETFIGGSKSDTSVGIGVDNGGNVYLAGNTSSPDFPTSGTPYQTAPETKGAQCASITCTSVFVSVLNPLGSILGYSSYLSGNGDDRASGMAIDAEADIFVTGTTTSNDTPSLTDAFPATDLPVPYQSVPASSIQFFVTKVDTSIPGVSSIVYSTYFGGSVPSGAVATGGGIAVDSTGNIYFSGTTNFYNSGSGVYGDSGQSGDFPILNAYQPCLDTPPPLVLSNPYPCTAPTTTPYPTDAFVAKLNPNNAETGGAQLLFSTYLGGSGTDSGAAIAVDAGAANIYLTGATNSSDFVMPIGVAPFQLCLDTPPVTPPNVPPCPAIASPPTDAYVARMSNPTLSTTGAPNDVALTYFSYLGGGGNDSGVAITTDTSGDALVTGATSSTNFPATAGAIQSKLKGTQNAFFAQINTTTVTGQSGTSSYVTYFGGNGVDRGTGIAVDPFLNTYFAGGTTSNDNTFETENPLQATLNGARNAFVAKLGPATDLCITCVAPVVSPTGLVSAGNQVTIIFTVANEGPDPATNISVNGTVPTGVTFNSATAGSGTCSAPSNNAVVCQIPTLQAGSTSLVTFAVTPNQPGSYEATAQVFTVNNTVTNIPASASFQAVGFSVSVAPFAQTVTAGLQAQYSVAVFPTNEVFGANVSLSCGALPTGAACDFANSTLTLNEASGSSTTLNLTTTAQPVNTIGLAGWRRLLYALWLMLPGMAVLGLGGAGRRRRWGNGKKSRLLVLLTLCVLCALVLLQPSCSSKVTLPTVSGTPSGTY
ncbi:MAG: SBBP repeat-containing protein, partial [Candidatus Sulfotelmatobacter sp.]